MVRSFVSSFFAGRDPAYSGPQRCMRPLLRFGPMRQPRERKGIGRCFVCAVYVRVVWGGGRNSRREQLVRHSERVPSRRGVLSG